MRLSIWSHILVVAGVSIRGSMAVTCPADNNTIYYTPNGDGYVIECYNDRAGGDIGSFDDANIEDGSACYLKGVVGPGQYNGGVWGARLVSGAPLPSGVSFLGCVPESPTRALPFQAYSNGANTPWNCAQACSASGYKYSGTEYSSECWCGSAKPSGTASSGDCSMACSGNAGLMCGGPNRLSLAADSALQDATVVTSYSSWTLASCYVDNPGSRTLPTGVSTPDGFSGLTTEKCLDSCAAAGFTYCGTEYSGECFGSNTAPDQSLALAGDPVQQGCDYPCNGNKGEVCGGASRILIYVNSPAQRIRRI
ncbi:WSC-domain-containing protein [Myriangium duriaei CBS 260.36]|uniref:WSC-domain-containing protein n=1 Tax=Myriangium duriaei CBS 260.36 TaxID=1168546 RepID=A0A9P4IW77_9PEZI|nr:WSC-domain-containing protein [Myriangium duriaei CBS 260.36]